MSGRAEAVALLRGLIERIVLHPAPEAPAGYVLDLEGDLAGILTLCQGPESKKAAGGVAGGLEQIKLVAGAGSGLHLPFAAYGLPVGQAA